MRIASRYLLTQYLASVTMLLAGIAATWMAADTMFHVDDLSKEPLRALRDVGFRSLDVLPLGLPLACVTGMVWSLTRAVRNREITAIRSGGIPLQAALVPLLLATLALSGLLILFEDRVVVNARAVLENVSDDPFSDDARRPELLNGRWWYSGGHSVLSAAGYEPEAGRLVEVTVFDMDDERRIRRRVEASTASNLSGDLWELEDAILFEMPREGGMSSSREASVQLDLELSRGDMARAMRPIGATSLRKLARRIRESRAGDRPPLEAAFHARIAQPLAAVVLVLFAVRFAIGDAERGDSLPRSLLLALGVTGLFWLCWTLALLVARSGVVPAYLPLWGVFAVTLALGVGRFRAIAE